MEITLFKELFLVSFLGGVRRKCSLKSELYTYKAGTVLLEPYFQSILL
jgi:hypothetical protein